MSMTSIPAPGSAILLQADGLHFSTPQRALFANWSARIQPGLTLVQGGDGSGKTTLLRLLAGELEADAGQLQINGIDLARHAAAYRQQVFWVDPRSEAFDQIRVRDYLASLPGQHPGFDPQALATLVAGWSLTPHLDKHFYMLSTGSRRKVWLAAAFASNAAVTLLDDPFAALDAASIAYLMTLLEQAAIDPARAWILAHYAAPGKVALTATIALGD
jgi:ABC-type multidrug transport system ATPase subunit